MVAAEVQAEDDRDFALAVDRQVNQEVLFGAGGQLRTKVKGDLLTDGAAVQGVVILLVNVRSDGQVLGGGWCAAEYVFFEQAQDLRAARGPGLLADGFAIAEGKRIEQSVGLYGRFDVVIAGRELGDRGASECRKCDEANEGAGQHIGKIVARTRDSSRSADLGDDGTSREGRACQRRWLG